MKSAARREQIAEAALAILSSDGMSGLNVAAIAERIGLVPSAIYRHFSSKEDILEAVIDIIGARLHGNAAAVCEETADPVERLRNLLSRHIELITANRGVIRVVFAEDVYENRPDLRKKLYTAIKMYLEKVADIIRGGQKDGVFRRDVDPGTISVMFLGLIQPSAVLWRLSGGEFDAKKQAAVSWELFECQIRKSDARIKKTDGKYSSS